MGFKTIIRSLYLYNLTLEEIDFGDERQNQLARLITDFNHDAINSIIFNDSLGNEDDITLEKSLASIFTKSVLQENNQNRDFSGIRTGNGHFSVRKDLEPMIGMVGLKKEEINIPSSCPSPLMDSIGNLKQSQNFLSI